VEIRAGDVVLQQTGWTDAKLAASPSEWVRGEPGILPTQPSYLAAPDVTAVGADTWGLDVVPVPAGGTTYCGRPRSGRDPRAVRQWLDEIGARRNAVTPTVPTE
jgi:kynurenine formamidase